MMKRNILITLCMMALVSILPACIEDDFTTSPSSQPTFSVDTLKMGEVFTLEGTPTKRFTVYNRHDKLINISSIGLRDDDTRLFRLNVDGISGTTFTNVEIRPKDSILVFVEATLPENGGNLPVEIKRHLDFVTNGVTTTVVLDIKGQDVVRLNDLEVTGRMTLTADKPYAIRGNLHVAQGATLTIEPGARLRMHDKAAITVDGTLSACGTVDRPIEIIGDRDGFVAAQIPYELMSGQWDGIYFGPTSHDNLISYASIRNSSAGIVLEGDAWSDTAMLTMVNSQVRNTTDRIITARHANVTLLGCELTDASAGVLYLVGGKHVVNHCTIANYYLFTAITNPLIEFGHINSEAVDEESRLPFMEAELTNNVIYGLGTDLSHGDLTGTKVYLRRCLLKSRGSDDDNFIACLWDADPLYYTVRNEYLFDYRVKPESPVIGAADTKLDIYGLTADRLGVAYGPQPDLGAYVFVAPEQ